VIGNEPRKARESPEPVADFILEALADLRRNQQLVLVTDVVPSVTAMQLHDAQGKWLYLTVDAAGSARPWP
jgi:hypothetical protein